MKSFASSPSPITHHPSLNKGRPMNTTTATRYEIDVEDVEYVRHGAKPLLARVYKPRGAGPFPVIIDLHGGAWTKKDRMSDVSTCEPLAKSGITVVALDFRMPPEAKYPASIADVNYAVRWCKANAKDLKSRPDMIGILGVSSGGHQATAPQRVHTPSPKCLQDCGGLQGTAVDSRGLGGATD